MMNDTKPAAAENATPGAEKALPAPRGRIIGRTAVGRATLDALRLNRPVVVDARRVWVAASRAIGDDRRRSATKIDP